MWEFIAIFVISYIWHACGITVGYHRLLSHRSYVAPKWFEYFWVLAGYLAFEGSPIWWSVIHRAHHKHVDTPLDPHSPRNGFWYAQFGWLTEKGYAPHISPAAQTKDLLADPIYRFLEFGGNWTMAHTFGFAVGFAYRGLIWALFGWQAALASLLAGFAVLQIPLMLNVVCHIPMLGYKNYKTSDDSVNVWWVGILAMGEGWHNNHHAAPGSARSGMRWYEFDLSWHIISLAHKLGIISRVNDFSEETLIRLAAAQHRQEIEVEIEKELSAVGIHDRAIPNVVPPVKAGAMKQPAVAMAAAAGSRTGNDAI